MTTKKSEWHPPRRGSDAFNCLYCNVYVVQKWLHPISGVRPDEYDYNGEPYIENLDKHLAVSICTRCHQTCVWVENKLIFPETTPVSVAPPNDDLDESIKKEYNEAASVLAKSPRAAAALLRRATERLCKELVGEDGEKNDLAKNIRLLEERRELSPQIVGLMDILRIAGNHASHPQGILDDADNEHIATGLFVFINDIADEAITKPKIRKQLTATVKDLDASSKADKK